MNDTKHATPRPPRLGTSAVRGLTTLDQRRLAAWISDAFAILCVRVSGNSEPERNLRLGFEAILRHLGTSPLRAITRSPPPLYGPPTATIADLKLIIKSLDACAQIFARYGSFLSATERHLESLIKSTRHFATEELQARRHRLARPLDGPSSIVPNVVSLENPRRSEIAPDTMRSSEKTDVAVGEVLARSVS